MYSPPLPRELYDATALKPFNARLFCYTVDTKWLSLFRYSPRRVCSVTLSRERWGRSESRAIEVGTWNTSTQ